MELDTIKYSEVEIDSMLKLALTSALSQCDLVSISQYGTNFAVRSC